MRYILITFGVVLLIIFGVVIFNRDSGQPNNPAGRRAIKLSDYVTNNNASVEYTVQGPIIALENHRSISIRISPTTRVIDVLTGYQGQVLRSQTYANDNNSYSDFLAALGRTGFTRERRLGGNINTQSICPTGNRSFYVINDNNKDVMNLWTASCTKGTYAGSTVTNNLFKAQIPDYTTITSGVNLGGSSSSNAIF